MGPIGDSVLEVPESLYGIALHLIVRYAVLHSDNIWCQADLCKYYIRSWVDMSWI